MFSEKVSGKLSGSVRYHSRVEIFAVLSLVNLNFVTKTSEFSAKTQGKHLITKVKQHLNAVHKRI